MKKIFIIAVLIVGFNAIFVFSGGLDLFMKKEQPEMEKKQGSMSPSHVDIFRFTLEDEVQKKIGTPIEGYEPQMYLQVFPGLVESDFDGVPASIGKYVMVEGRLVHKLDETQLIHSAAGALTRQGIAALLVNVSQRIDVDLNAEGTLTDIFSAIAPSEE